MAFEKEWHMLISNEIIDSALFEGARVTSAPLEAIDDQAISLIKLNVAWPVIRKRIDYYRFHSRPAEIEDPMLAVWYAIKRQDICL